MPEWAYDKRAMARLAAKTQQTDSECWVWTGSKDHKGYGQFWYSGHLLKVHRAAWILYRGEVPTGLVLDHLCRNRACANPWHLDPVTSQVNTKRGNTGAHHGRKTHCPKGHAYNELNTSTRHSGRRGCKACDAEYSQRKRREN